MISYINYETGLNATTCVDLMSLYFGLIAEKTEGCKLPQWVNQDVFNFLKNATNYEYKVQTSSRVLVTQTGGTFITVIYFSCLIYSTLW